jgi:hypothetical protein
MRFEVRDMSEKRGAEKIHSESVSSIEKNKIEKRRSMNGHGVNIRFSIQKVWNSVEKNQRVRLNKSQCEEKKKERIF